MSGSKAAGPSSNPLDASARSASTEPAARTIRQRVRDQYEQYPYPPRAPLGSRPVTAFGLMDYVQHVLWPGRPNLRGLRVLDAGCGTGYTAARVAHDYPEAEVVGIDLSEASLAAARAYADELGVGDNLTLQRLSIEDAGALDGRFDYIIASGVLHHLADPNAGLSALADKLSPTGGFGIMVYATYGRQPIYMVQDLLGRLAGEEPLEARVGLARKLLGAWPETHPFRAKDWMDMTWEDDAGLVDLLLHSQDRSYTVPEVLSMLGSAGLRLERFYDPFAYAPSTYAADPDIARVVSSRPAAEQATIAELLHGAMRKHAFFATRTSYQPVHVAPEGLVLMALRPKRSPVFDWEGAQQEKGNQGQLVVRRHAFDAVRAVELSAWKALVVGLCGGDRTTEAIFAMPEVRANVPGPTLGEKLDSYGRFMEQMAAIGLLLFDL